MVVPMTWSTNIQVSAAAGFGVYGAQQTYHLNDVFATQPYGYGILSQIYSKYRVKAATLDIVFNNQLGAGLANDVYVAANITPSSGGRSLAAATTASVDGWSSADQRFVSTTGPQITRITKRFSIAELEGLTHVEWAGNSGYSALSGASPALNPSVEIACAWADAAAGGVGVVLRMTMEVEWYARTSL
jgi:hypothetical protein